MTFIKSKKYQVDMNLYELKVLRAKFCAETLKMLYEGKVAICYDESTFDRTNFNHKSWVRKGQKNVQKKGQLSQRISLISAVDSTGKFYYSLM
jgi:hypothetical protein